MPVFDELATTVAARRRCSTFTFDGGWTVEHADGQFAAITWSGTDTLHAAWARVTGTYRETS